LPILFIFGTEYNYIVYNLQPKKCKKQDKACAELSQTEKEDQ